MVNTTDQETVMLRIGDSISQPTIFPEENSTTNLLNVAEEDVIEDEDSQTDEASQSIHRMEQNEQQFRSSQYEKMTLDNRQNYGSQGTSDVNFRIM